VYLIQNTVVKEQRVDGSRCFDIKHLRYTLMGFERNYQVKIPSKQIINKRLYSSIVERSSRNKCSLNPWFITGFLDAEGSFMVIVRENPKNRTGWLVVVIFSIALHKRDMRILEDLQAYFGGAGSIRKNGKDTFKFRIESLELISNLVIPHFDKYPLVTQKLGDYLLFKTVVGMMKAKEHLTDAGIKKIVAIKASMNNGLSAYLYVALPNLKPVPRPIVENKKVPHEQWIAGFTSGEGCFKVIVAKTPNTKLGFRVLLGFQISQHIRDEKLMTSLITYFGCGIIEKDPRGPSLYYSVYKFSENYEKIIPFFKKHKIVGIKSEDFADWCKVAELIEAKDHLTSSGLDKIRKIKSGMNKGRYN
jgi:LAGLIDADG endonuclease